ncbi:MAG: hypothetical protein NT055_07970 [Nitrospirae bacterium]|nr:hypothetical protein [Nitrospirota bacterium]
MVALDFAIGPSFEVIIAGDLYAKDARAMIRQLRAEFVPNKVVLFKSTKGKSCDMSGIADFTKQYTCMGGKATAYVCRDYQCSLPTTDVSAMMEMLNRIFQ